MALAGLRGCSMGRGKTLLESGEGKMKNGDMPANVLTSSAGALWNLRDGHEDSNYIGQPGDRFSFGFTKREDVAKSIMAALCVNNSLGWIDEHAAKTAVALTDKLLAELERTK